MRFICIWILFAMFLETSIFSVIAIWFSGSRLIIVIIRVKGNFITTLAIAIIGFIMWSNGLCVCVFFKRCPSFDNKLIGNLFENHLASFEVPFLALFRVFFFCLFALYMGEAFFVSLSISQDIAAVNSFAILHSKVLSVSVSPPRWSLSSLTIQVVLFNLRLNWGDRLIQGVTLIAIPP